MMEAVKENGNALQAASIPLQSDHEIVITAIRQNPLSLLYASKHMKQDEQVVLEAVSRNMKALAYASTDLQSNRSLLVKAFTSTLQKDFVISSNHLGVGRHASIQDEGDEEERKSNSIFSDASFLYEVIQHGTIEILQNEEFFSFRNDCDFMLQALRYNIKALKYASQSLRNDKDFMKNALSILMLKSQSTEGQKGPNESVSKLMLQIQCYYELKDAFDSNKQSKIDPSVVLKALQFDGLALQYTSKEMQNDMDMVMEAVKNFRYRCSCHSEENEQMHPLIYASSEMRNDHQVVMTSLEYGCTCSLQYASEALRSDKVFIMEQIKRYGASLMQFVSDSLWNDSQVIEIAIQAKGFCKMRKVSQEYLLSQSKEIILQKLKLVCKQPDSYHQVHLRKELFKFFPLTVDHPLLNDEELWFSALSFRSQILEMFPLRFFNHAPQKKVIESLKHNGSCLDRLPEKVKQKLNCKNMLLEIALLESGFSLLTTAKNDFERRMKHVYDGVVFPNSYFDENCFEVISEKSIFQLLNSHLH
ncbi:hypothetical protein C9374_009883 [Naegleria lovaniensis]|uniref:DUF4116 domain-containing protein n=1 Tax=Naegleria lovaniensis TaxID=51637 RepID=A0AA88KE40_NAELO|nr:uncharacterized protein C9374_009883 [Naegleria lovaniensis]KAG2375260.1 hypothetical protein C9374_009883 [Naegleria lovaniensis]